MISPYVMDQANRVADYYLRDRSIIDLTGAEKILGLVEKDLSDIQNSDGKLAYMSKILEEVEIFIFNHRENCKSAEREKCIVEKSYNKMTHFLTLWINNLDFKIPDDQFTFEEKRQVDEILKDLEQKVDLSNAAFELLYQELRDLKNLMIIGKKNWLQLAGVKVTEAIALGVVTDATAQPLLEVIKSSFPNLLPR